MKRNESNGIVWYSFELLEQQAGIQHASFTRHGGLSNAPFASLNLGYGIGDKDDSVTENLRLSRAILDTPTIAWAQQEHGSKIVEVTADTAANVPVCDALVTRDVGIALMIKHADCQPCILYDPIQRVVANIHAGWRGNALDIYGATLQYLRSQFKCQMKDIIACIGPSLGPQGAEFIHFKEEFPKSQWKYANHQRHMDLWRLGEEQLLAQGVLAEHIEIAKICTWSEPEDFFSYRRDGETGRHGSFVALSDTPRGHRP